MSNIINWGIIAPGKIARKFAADMRLVEGANLYAVASRDMDRAEDFAREFNADRFFDSYLDLVEDPNVDVVYIASPHPFHFEQSMLCLQNGKNVLCEKPIGMNAQQVEALIEIAKKNNLFLMEALWTRFVPSFVKCLDLIQNGEIGEVRFIQADFGFRAEYDVNQRTFNKELGGGSLLDIGIYPVFIALEIAGEPDELMATAIIGETGIDETCSIVFKYPPKKLAVNLSSSFLVDTPTEALICGTDGQIRLHGKWHNPTNLSLKKNGKEESIAFDEPGNGYEYEIREVMDCLSRGEFQSVKFPLSKSLLLHQTLDRIRQAIGLEY